MLVAFLAGGALAVEAVTFYLAAYFLTMLIAFGVVTVLSVPERDADRLEDYRALFWRRPWLAGLLTAALFSLAGIPLTAGFVGKVYLLGAGVHSALWTLVLTLVVGSAIGLFYYLRIVVALYSRPAPEEIGGEVGEKADEKAEKKAGEGVPGLPALPALSLTGSVVLAVLILLLIWFGLYPAPLLTIIREAMIRFV
jgi:NADH-quinone oxidoreductase subunit N